MKKFIAFIFTMSLLITKVDAASLCTYEEQTKLNSKAANIKVSYEIITEEVEYADMTASQDLFNISILNITEEFYVVVKNDINNEEKIYHYQDTTDGMVSFKWDYVDTVTNFNIQIYTTNKTSCPEEKYKTVYLTTPRYNEYSNYEICQRLSDFYLCQEFVTFSEIDEAKFDTQIDKYINGDVNSEGEKVKDTDELKLTDKIFSFIDDYKWYIIGGSLVLIISITVIYRAKTKKQRELGL